MRMKSDDLQAAGMPFALHTSGDVADADTTAPRLVSLDFQPRVIDYAVSSTIQVTVHVADDQTGVKYLHLGATDGPRGAIFGSLRTDQSEGGFSDGRLLSGDKFDGTYTFPIKVEPFTLAPGTAYNLELHATDVAGNNMCMKSADLQAAGMPFALHTSGDVADADTTAPRLVSLDFQPRVIDYAVSSTIQVTVHIADDQTGVKSLHLRATDGPRGAISGSLRTDQIEWSFADGRLLSGDKFDGTYTFPIKVEPFTLAPGTAYNVELHATDVAGNNMRMKSADLQAAGMPFALHTSGDVADADTTAPRLVSLDFQPRVIDYAVSSTIQVTVHIA